MTESSILGDYIPREVRDLQNKQAEDEDGACLFADSEIKGLLDILPLAY